MMHLSLLAQTCIEWSWSNVTCSQDAILSKLWAPQEWDGVTSDICIPAKVSLCIIVLWTKCLDWKMNERILHGTYTSWRFRKPEISSAGKGLIKSLFSIVSAIHSIDWVFDMVLQAENSLLCRLWSYGPSEVSNSEHKFGIRLANPWEWKLTTLHSFEPGLSSS